MKWVDADLLLMNAEKINLFQRYLFTYTYKLKSDFSTSN
jgi:hypothetical protein